MHNLSCENEFYLHENEKRFPYQRLSTYPRFETEAHETRKWPIALSSGYPDSATRLLNNLVTPGALSWGRLALEFAHVVHKFYRSSLTALFKPFSSPLLSNQDGDYTYRICSLEVYYSYNAGSSFVSISTRRSFPNRLQNSRFFSQNQ